MNQKITRLSLRLILSLIITFSTFALVACDVQQENASGSDMNNAEQMSSELAPLTEDIYYQGSAEPANEPYSEKGAENRTYTKTLSFTAMYQSTETPSVH